MQLSCSIYITITFRIVILWNLLYSTCGNVAYRFFFSSFSLPGSVDVAVDSLDMGVEVEKWYPVTMESNKTNGGESSSIRLRFKYQVKLHRLPSYK